MAVTNGNGILADGRSSVVPPQTATTMLAERVLHMWDIRKRNQKVLNSHLYFSNQLKTNEFVTGLDPIFGSEMTMCPEFHANTTCLRPDSVPGATGEAAAECVRRSPSRRLLLCVVVLALSGSWQQPHSQHSLLAQFLAPVTALFIKTTHLLPHSAQHAQCSLDNRKHSTRHRVLNRLTELAKCRPSTTRQRHPLPPVIWTK